MQIEDEVGECREGVKKRMCKEGQMTQTLNMKREDDNMKKKVTVAAPTPLQNQVCSSSASCSNVCQVLLLSSINVSFSAPFAG